MAKDEKNLEKDLEGEQEPKQKEPENVDRKTEEDLEDTFDEKSEEVEAEGQTVPLGKYQRLQADFENYKRRSRQDMEQMTCLGKEQVIQELLEVIDNFSRALAAEDSGDLKEFKKGMSLIFKQFQSVLEKHGLKPIEAEGALFDPEYHEAVMQIETDSEDEDRIVLEDLQKGYVINGKVIRPSMVKVGKYNKQGQEDDDE